MLINKCIWTCIYSSHVRKTDSVFVLNNTNILYAFILTLLTLVFAAHLWLPNSTILISKKTSLLRLFISAERFVWAAPSTGQAWICISFSRRLIHFGVNVILHLLKITKQTSKRYSITVEKSNTKTTTHYL